eukprot:4402742-Amphidinium_carterae.1
MNERVQCTVDCIDTIQVTSAPKSCSGEAERVQGLEVNQANEPSCMRQVESTWHQVTLGYVVRGSVTTQKSFAIFGRML